MRAVSNSYTDEEFTSFRFRKREIGPTCCCRMPTHFLKSNVDTVHWGHLSAAIPAKLTIDPGDRVVVDTLSGGRSDIGGDLSNLTPEHREIIDQLSPFPGPHILTGPVAVRGAAVGDTLEVRIVDVELTADWGYNIMRPGRGALPEEFPFPRGMVMRCRAMAKWT